MLLDRHGHRQLLSDIPLGCKGHQKQRNPRPSSFRHAFSGPYLPAGYRYSMQNQDGMALCGWDQKDMLPEGSLAMTVASWGPVQSAESTRGYHPETSKSIVWGY